MAGPPQPGAYLQLITKPEEEEEEVSSKNIPDLYITEAQDNEGEDVMYV